MLTTQNTITEQGIKLVELQKDVTYIKENMPNLNQIRGLMDCLTKKVPNNDDWNSNTTKTASSEDEGKDEEATMRSCFAFQTKRKNNAFLVKSSIDDGELRRACDTAIEDPKHKIIMALSVTKSHDILGFSLSPLLVMTWCFLQQNRRTDCGNGILALTSNGDHLLWKWPCNNLNLDGKTVMTIMPPSPMATCLAFYRRDNILAVAMDNSSIIIYNVRTKKIISKLEGHSKRVTALAFSSSFDLLVSVDINAQIFYGTPMDGKNRKKGYLKIRGQKVPEVLSETHIQFHLYQK
ncbi:hypothetical protein VNO78_00876 [Psophocarpus tetragonolobus]|uniref:Anaphase-promoting complex subunit 4-like WD40 domain-containing protein n=1 Tax=Psophocarpus tetragonolobus TaxID=3891 RepID=A0AAN9T8I5_PSOTE